jgi:hypothetical protein
VHAHPELAAVLLLTCPGRQLTTQAHHAFLQDYEGQLAAATAELQDKLTQQAEQLRSQGNELRHVCAHRDDYDRAYRVLEKEQVAEAKEADRKLRGLSGKLAAVEVGVLEWVTCSCCCHVVFGL